MTFKKILRSSGKGQAILEYFLLLLAIAGLTLLSTTSVLPMAKDKGETFFQNAIGRMTTK